jgi:hypothetical protein
VDIDKDDVEIHTKGINMNYKEQIIKLVESMDEVAERRFLAQILIMIKTHLRR